MRYATLCTLAALFVALPAICHGHTLTVDCNGGGDYVTIQEAVNAASSGDTIAVAACVYKEQVIIPDIPLVIVGEGAGITEVTWSGAGGTVEFEQSDLALHDLTVRHTVDSGLAIAWDEQSLTLVACTVLGRVNGGYYYGEVHVRDSNVASLTVCGGFRTSTVERSRLDHATFYAPWQTCHTLESSESRYGKLARCFMYCSGDTIGYVDLSGAADAAEYLQAEGCRIDTCIGWYSAELYLDSCEIGAFTYEADHMVAPRFGIRGCLFTEDVVVFANQRCEASPSQRSRGYYMEHNTILGEFTFDMATSTAWPENHIRSNIAVGPSVISCVYELVVSHNDFAGGLTLNAPVADVFANITEDPLFCDAPVGDYTVHENSPCNSAAHDGSVIGAFPVGCYVPVERVSWGAIKARFR